MRKENAMFRNFDSHYWDTVVATIQEGLMLIDQKGKILFVNKAFERLMGYSSQELVGKSCEIFLCDNRSA